MPKEITVWRSAALLLLLLVAIVPWPAHASCPLPAPDTDVAVGVRPAPPFITQDTIRGRGGLAIELWQSIARDLQQQGIIGTTEFVECSLDEQLKALAAGHLDVVVSPLTITQPRMARFDFTHQYLSSGITVARQHGDIINFGNAWNILKNTVAQPGVPHAIVFILLLNLFLAALVATSLKGHVDFDVISHESRLLRILRVVVETISRTTGLYAMGDAFRTTLAKTLEAFMALVGTLLSAAIFGVLAAALLGSIGTQDDVSIGQLPTLRIATLGNSTSQLFIENLSRGAMNKVRSTAFSAGADENSTRPRVSLTSRRRMVTNLDEEAGMAPVLAGLPQDLPPIDCKPATVAEADDRCLTTDSWVTAMQLLAAGKVEAVLGDWAQLSYLARLPQFNGNLQVQSAVFRNEPYGWGVNPHRPRLRDAINAALIRRLRDVQWRDFVQEYLGSGSIGAN